MGNAAKEELKAELISVGEMYWLDYLQAAEHVEPGADLSPERRLFVDGFVAGVLHGVERMKKVRAAGDRQ